MKKIIGIVILSLLLGFVGCKNNNEDAELAQDFILNNEKDIKQYLAKNNIVTQNTSSGLYYALSGVQIGNRPDTTNNYIFCKYTTRLIPSEVIIDSNYIQTQSKLFIQPINGNGIGPIGFLESLTLMGKGNKGIFLMNNSLGYKGGVSGNPFIAPYSAIRIDIDLIDVKSESQMIDEYISQKGYTLFQTNNECSIVKFNSVGLGLPVLATSKVRINYIGKLLTNEKIFDARNSTLFDLNLTTLIQGFRTGLTSFRVGERGLILIPSRKGYAGTATGEIPPYSPLIFEVEILTVE
jgi:FKBP-type peptidyl-prolyl cis-trans isomerase